MEMPTWFSATGFVDLVIVITLVEAVALWVWSRWRGAIDFDALLPSLASGLMLMAALRTAVGGAAWQWVVLPVALAGACHLWDLQRRWSRSRAAARSVNAVPRAPSQIAPLSPP
jgi:hypothetical protein